MRLVSTGSALAVVFLAILDGGSCIAPGARAQDASQSAVRPENIEPPVRTKFVPPVYPPIAQSARVEGDVVLEVRITAAGRVERATVLRSIPMLDKAAVDAVLQWEYVPVRLNNIPVPISARVTVNFRLMDLPATKSTPADNATPARTEGPRSSSPGRPALTASPSPVPPFVASRLAALGPCNAAPNYVRSTGLNRWAAFPLTYSVDVSGVPANLQQVYADIGVVARDLWSIATTERIGVLRQTNERNAQISVQFVPVGHLSSAGRTLVEYEAGVIARATIWVMRHGIDEQLMLNDARIRLIKHMVSTLSHEIGHALGIEGHSPSRDDLMFENGNFYVGRDDDPRNFITLADRNTMLHAYCGPSSAVPATAATPAPSVPPALPPAPMPPRPTVPFIGRWQCSVDPSQVSPGAFKTFTFRVQSDGMVSMPGAGDELRPVMTDSSLRFESRGGGTTDTVVLTGNSTGLRGSRTLTISGMAPVRYDISCGPGPSR
jgi:TonB family protein